MFRIQSPKLKIQNSCVCDFDVWRAGFQVQEDAWEQKALSAAVEALKPVSTHPDSQALKHQTSNLKPQPSTLGDLEFKTLI